MRKAKVTWPHAPPRKNTQTELRKLRKAAAADAKLIADLISKNLALETDVERLNRTIDWLHDTILKLRKDDVGRPETAFIVENPVITFPPDAIVYERPGLYW